MKLQQIIELADVFTKLKFNFEAAYELLGSKQKQSEFNVDLNPHKTWECDQIILETLPTPDHSQLLAGVILRFTRPVEVDLGVLSTKWADWKELPRLKPHQPVPIRFFLPSADYDAYLVFNVAGHINNVRASVVSVIIRRFEKPTQ